MNVVRLHCDAAPYLRTLTRMHEQIARAFAIPPEILRAAEWQDWRARLERWRAALGATPGTAHVTNGEWLEHWRAGLDPVGALLMELRE